MKREELAKTYTGDKAATYDSKRRSSEKWQQEQNAVHQILESLPRGIKLIDVPVGTGRFIELYHELGIAASGVDISDDMIARANEKANKLGAKISLYQGSIFEIPAANSSFDCALCIRLLNWLSLPDVELALRELSRVSSKFIVVGIRTMSGNIGTLNRIVMIGEGFWRKFLSKKRARNKTTVHTKLGVLSIFARLDLAVLHSETVNAGMRGTTYDLFLLEKRPA
jgi:ubiquinone/menaquinone biosynthesis C-methylase UbiE